MCVCVLRLEAECSSSVGGAERENRRLETASRNLESDDVAVLTPCSSSNSVAAAEGVSRWYRKVMAEGEWSQNQWSGLGGNGGGRPDAVNGGPHHRAQEIECAVKDRMAADYATDASGCRRGGLSQMSGVGAPEFASAVRLSRLVLQLGRDAELLGPDGARGSQSQHTQQETQSMKGSGLNPPCCAPLRAFLARGHP